MRAGLLTAFAGTITAPQSKAGCNCWPALLQAKARVLRRPSAASQSCSLPRYTLHGITGKDRDRTPCPGLF